MLVNTSMQKDVKPENVDLFIKTKKQMVDLLRNNFVISDPNHIGYFWYAPCKERKNWKRLEAESDKLLLAKNDFKDTKIKKPVSVKKALQG